MFQLLFLLVACTPDTATEEDTSPPIITSGEGVLAVTFRINTDYQDLMQEPAVGMFYGSFWYGDDVSAIGPAAGAVDLGGFEVMVDLTDGGGPTEVLYTSDLLPAEEIVILGFLDSDGNADPVSPNPDDKDPVTLPGDNDFDVVGDAVTTVEVYFGLLNP